MWSLYLEGSAPQETRWTKSLPSWSQTTQNVLLQCLRWIWRPLNMGLNKIPGDYLIPNKSLLPISGILEHSALWLLGGSRHVLSPSQMKTETQTSCANRVQVRSGGGSRKGNSLYSCQTPSQWSDQYKNQPTVSPDLWKRPFNLAPIRNPRSSAF